MSRATQVDALLKQYVSNFNNKVYEEEPSWKVDISPVAGIGIFATRNIAATEDIFTDFPLIYGPRSKKEPKSICVACYKNKQQLKPCSAGCGLPVCSNKCESSSIHKKDCKLILEWIKKNNINKFTDWSYDMLRSLTPIRGLHLTKRELEIIDCLQQNSGYNHGFEVELLKKHGLFPTPEEKHIMCKICYTLDTNAFQILGQTDDKVSLRGIYPLAGILNHTCSPNTSHVFEDDRRMIMRASKDIAAGEEITTSYTNLLWNTLTRRHYLLITKHFSCECERCQDPTEFGSNLSALKCKRSNCEGIMLPAVPLNFKSFWKCNCCGSLMSSVEIGTVQSVLCNIVSSIKIDSPSEFIELIRDRLPKAIPGTNQLIVEFQCRMLWSLGHADGVSWPELSDETLEYKIQVCREMLERLELLKLGQCRLRGFTLRELDLSLEEKAKRSTSKSQDLIKESKTCRLEASQILKNHIVMK